MRGMVYLVGKENERQPQGDVNADADEQCTAFSGGCGRPSIQIVRFCSYVLMAS